MGKPNLVRQEKTAETKRKLPSDPESNKVVEVVPIFVQAMNLI